MYSKETLTNINLLHPHYRVLLLMILCTLLQAGSISAQEGPVTPREPHVTPIATEAYLAKTESEAIAVTVDINFLPQNEFEHPSNACGPLTAQILYDNNLMPLEIFSDGEFDPSLFWLATPDRLNQLLRAPYYTMFEIAGPIWFVDFSQVNLQVGDFIYLQGGTFDHMLTVTKIEPVEGGEKVYSVTNFYTSEGFVIDEVLLFNTADPAVGLFKTSFRNPNSWTGQTGLSRMLVYRPNPEYLATSTEDEEITESEETTVATVPHLLRNRDK